MKDGSADEHGGAGVRPRAVGEAIVAVAHANGSPRLARLRQAGAMRCLLPRRRGHAVDAVLVNTAGGITSGDRFAIDAEAGPGTHLTLTTQAAERIYDAGGGPSGAVETRIRVGCDARADWLPQETILFERANLRRRLSVDLDAGAAFLMCEALVFGRTARGEELRDARLEDRVSIVRGGRPVYVDGIDLAGDIAATLDRPAVANGARAVANVVFCAPEAEGLLARVRAGLPREAGASWRDGLLLVRLLGQDGYDLRRALLPVLDILTRSRLPAVWRL